MGSGNNNLLLSIRFSYRYIDTEESGLNGLNFCLGS